jgi:hypothetical protein
VICAANLSTRLLIDSQTDSEAYCRQNDMFSTEPVFGAGLITYRTQLIT